MLINGADVELRIHRKDRALERDAIADFPAEALHELRADDRALTVVRARLKVGVAHVVIVEHRFHMVVIDSEVREELLRLLVIRAEPLHLADIDDAGNLPDLRLMRDRQNVRQRDRRLRSEEHTSELQSRGLISYAVF